MPTSVHPTVTIDSVSMNEIAIRGTITDNYANISIEMEIENPESSAQETLISFSTDERLFLSNFSLDLNDLTYWGEIKPIIIAQQEYQNATESNQTAVLVEKVGENYNSRFNLKAGETGTLVFYFEGYITRELGIYDFVLFDFSSSAPTVQTIVDIELVSSKLDFRTTRIFGTPDFVTDKNSSSQYSLSYNGSMTHSSPITARYRYFSDGLHQTLLSYSNGTTNFFLYSFAPEIYTISEKVDREYIFVLDTSGSMRGDRIGNAKLALKSLLDTLANDDLFNLITFATGITSYQSSAIAATGTNIQAAQDWIDNLVAEGSTDLDGGITTALNQFSEESSRAKVVVFISDGEPTAGERDTNQILTNVQTANDQGVTIYSVGLGDSSAEGLMASIAFRNGGEFTVITNSGDIDEQIGLLYEKFRLPVATNLEITYTGTTDIINPTSDILGSNIFNGSEVIQTGIYETSLTVETSITSVSGSEVFSNSVSTTNSSLDHIERIWAINTIESLLKLNVLNDKASLRDTITQMAVYYQLLVDGYTGLILVVDEKEPTETTDTTNDDAGTTTTDTTDTTQTTTSATTTGSQTTTHTDTETATETATDTETDGGVGAGVQDPTETAESSVGSAVALPAFFLIPAVIPMILLKRKG